MIAHGGSAGGLLMGAIANMAPDRYRVLIADVPFVDIVTTMLDESIPLTAGEYDEWGDPREAEYYDYMLSYSPYDQVAAHAYPAMLVTTGLWDSQVQYFEPAKWVAQAACHQDRYASAPAPHQHGSGPRRAVWAFSQIPRDCDEVCVCARTARN